MKHFIVALLILAGVSQSLWSFEKSKLWLVLKEGRYTKKIAELTNQFSRENSKIKVSEKSNELMLLGIRTADDSTYLGIMAKTLVHSKVDAILKVFRNIAGYQKLYPGLDEVKSVVTQNDFEIHWNFSVPLGAHIIYDTVQSVTPVNTNKGFLIYQLKKSDDVVETDGFVFLQEQGDSTKYLSVDFFNAKWGFAGKFFKNLIWKTYFENTKISTLSVKEQAEKSAYPRTDGSEKILVSYVGLDDRAKQKTFESLASEIFTTDTDSAPDINAH